MPVLSARTRWLAPAAVVLAVGGTASAAALTAEASPPLAPKSAAQLLVDLQNAKVTGLSGTVVQNADLGLPELPHTPGTVDLTRLVSGSNTVRLWYAGPTKVRLALLGVLGESDVIRNGRDVWTWSSDRNSYTHESLPADALHADGWPDRTPTTPQQAADQALALAGPSTDVSIDGTAMVAHRRAYELVLAPKDTRSLVRQVRVAVDAERSVPLRVRVFAKGANQPAYEVGFTQVSFATPGEEQFRFVPPRGATLDKGSGDTGPGERRSRSGPAGPEQRRVVPDARLAEPGAPGVPGKLPGHGLPASGEPRVVGTGWTTVLVANAGTPDLGPQFGAVLGQLPRVSGSWGSGRELRGALFTLVLTDDGRVAAGLVAPELVYRALGAR
jgi:outer membrane lipoprotein-sorting protein